MGTYYSVKVVANENAPGLNGAREAIEKRLVEINQVFSTYLSDSELSKINKLPAGKGMALSKEMESLLDLSGKISKETLGYFDITVGPIVNAWGFGPDGKQKRPTNEALDKMKESVGMDQFSVESGKLLKNESSLYIDLSAIAKGYGVDQVLALLKERGFSSALVEIGGEVRALGKKPNQADWLIGIEKPQAKLGSGIQAIVALKDMAMATSGSYRNYVKYGDEIFSHTIDPLTARPAQNNVISVSVLAPTCAKADAYATAFLSMGHQQGLFVAKKLGLPVYFIVKKGGKPAIIMSESFKPFIKKAVK